MDAVTALRAGRPVLLPTDTVYGLVGNPEREDWARAALAVKGRDHEKPTALLAASVADLLERLPEASANEGVFRALLPGPYTLVVPNPAARYPWLTGGRTAIGVRVPALPPAARDVVTALGAVLATSANDPGRPDPARLGDVPARIRSACAAEIDAGELPGVPSTVVDLSGDVPRVLREGAVSAGVVLGRIAAVAHGRPD